MPTYRAREPIYLCGENRLIEAGEVFSSDEPAGLAWLPLDTVLPESVAAGKALPVRRSSTLTRP